MADDKTSQAKHLTSVTLDISQFQANLKKMSDELDTVATKAVKDADKIKSSLGGIGGGKNGKDDEASGLKGIQKRADSLVVTLAKLREKWATATPPNETMRRAISDLNSLYHETVAVQEAIESETLKGKKAKEALDGIDREIKEVTVSLANMGNAYKTAGGKVATALDFDKMYKRLEAFNTQLTSSRNIKLPTEEINKSLQSLIAQFVKARKEIAETGIVTQKQSRLITTAESALVKYNTELAKLQREQNIAKASVESTNKAVKTQTTTLDKIINLQTAYTKQINAMQAQGTSNVAYQSLTKQAQEYSSALDNLRRNAETLGKITPQMAQQYSVLAQRLANVKLQAAQLEPTIKAENAAYRQMEKDIASAVKQLQRLASATKNTQVKSSAQELATAYEKLGKNLRKMPVSEAQKSLGKLGETISDLGKNTEKSTTLLQNFATHLTNRARWMATYAVLDTIATGFSNIGSSIIAAEDAAIELQRVLGSGSPALGNMKEELNDIAYEFGQTFENVQQVAVRFAQTGMDWNETIDATRATMLGLNTAELEVETATNGLIAVMAQFHLQASDLEEVIDKINITADNFPVTSEKIVAALQRAGGTASAYNLTLEETIGLITALSEATGRSGESIGTALNSLISFSMKESSLKTFSGFLGFDVSQGYDVLQIWELLGEKIKGGEEAVAEFMAGSAEFAELFNEQLAEAVGAQDELNLAVENGEAVYSSVGVYRKNYFIALLNNINTAREAMQGMTEATGYSLQENETAMSTLSKKIEQLMASARALAIELGESGVLDFAKTLVDAASATLQLTNNLGGLRVVMGGLLSIVLVLEQQKIADGISKIASKVVATTTSVKGLTTALKGLNFAGVTGLVIGLATAVTGLVTGFRNAKKEAQELAIATRQDLMESGKQAETSIYNLTKALSDYEEAMSKGSKAEKAGAQKTFLSYLGYTEGDIQALIQDGETLDEMLRRLAEEQKKVELGKLAEGAKAAAEAFQDLNPEVIKLYGAGADEAKEAYGILEKAGVSFADHTTGIFQQATGTVKEFVVATSPQEAARQIETLNIGIANLEKRYGTTKASTMDVYKAAVSYRNALIQQADAANIAQQALLYYDTELRKTYFLGLALATGQSAKVLEQQFVSNFEGKLQSAKEAIKELDAATTTTTDTGTGTGKTKAEQMLDSLTEKLEVYEHSIFLLEKSGDSADKLVAVYRKMQEEIHAMAQKYRDMGYSENSEYIRKLQEDWWKYQDNITELIKESYEDSIKARQNALDLLENQYGILQSSGDYTGAAKNLQKQLNAQLEIQELAHKRAQELRKQGVAENDEAIQQAISDWWSAADDIEAIKENIQESIIEPFDNFIDLADEFDLWSALDITKFDYLQQKLQAINKVFEQGNMSLKEYNGYLQEMATALYEAKVDSFQSQIDKINQDLESEKAVYEKDIEDWEKRKEKAEEYYDSLIDSLNEVQEDNERINRQLDYYNDRQKVITNLEQAQARSGVEWRQKEMEYQQELIDLDKDWNRTQQDWDIEEQISRLEELKLQATSDIQSTVDSIKSAIEALESEAEQRVNELKNQITALGTSIKNAISAGTLDGLIDSEAEMSSAWQRVIEVLGGKISDGKQAVVEGTKQAGTESKTAFDINLINPAKVSVDSLSKYLKDSIVSSATSAAKSAATSFKKNFTEQVQKDMASVNKQAQTATGGAIGKQGAMVAMKNYERTALNERGVGTIYIQNNVASQSQANSKTNSLLYKTKIK